MATYVEISDPADPRLDDYRNLKDVQLRQSLEAEHGLFLAEGAKVVRRATAAGFPVRSLLMAPRWLESLADVIEATDAPCYVLDESLSEKVTGFHVHRGALASLARRPLPTVAEVLEGQQRQAKRIAIFEDIVDHANLGAGFRSAAALGLDAVLITPSCADPYYRRSIKVSMGTVFQVPWTRIDPWPAGMDELRADGYVVAALTLAGDAITLDELAATNHSRLAIVMGTEGRGIHSRTAAMADFRVRIPMAGIVDSLNVAAAAAVTFYATRNREGRA